MPLVADHAGQEFNEIKKLLGKDDLKLDMTQFTAIALSQDLAENDELMTLSKTAIKKQYPQAQSNAYTYDENELEKAQAKIADALCWSES